MSLSEATKKFLKENCGEDVQIIERDSSFKYDCSCCGDCCRDRDGVDSILLSTQDIFYLAKGLNIKIMDFIKKYTACSVGSESGLTVIVLKSESTYKPGPFAKIMPNKSKCTFLTYKDGKYLCKVNDFKPSVCRIFPLGRLSTSDNTKDLVYFLQSAGCQKGKNISDEKTHTLESWIPNLDRSESEFKKQSAFLAECLDIINFKAVYNSDKISETYKQTLFVTMIQLWYCGFDTKIDFLEQFDSVKDKYFEFLKNLVSFLQEKDPSVRGREFNDFVDKEDAMLYMAQVMIQMNN